MGGMLGDHVGSILIDPGSNYSYISPDLVDKFCLDKEVHVEYWLVQLVTETNIRVHRWGRYCAFELNGMLTSAHLNVLPLGSCSMLLGMDLLVTQKTKVDFCDKVIVSR